jgi:hypothetical protein
MGHTIDQQMLNKAMQECNCDSGILLNKVNLKKIIAEFIEDDRKNPKDGLSHDLLEKAMETECVSGILINSSTLYYLVLEFVKNDQNNRDDDDSD